MVDFPAPGAWCVAGASRMGSRREANEDRWVVVPPANERPLLLAVADGVGGAAAGERASAAAVEGLAAAWRGWQVAHAPSAEQVRDKLQEAAEDADRAVQRLPAHDVSFRGAATTLTVAAVTEAFLVVVHAGDSRAYVVRENLAHQITSDHTWVAQQVAENRMDAAGVERHPMRSVITRYLGQSTPCEFDVVDAPRRAGDWLILCTDGVSNIVSPAELAGQAAGARIRQEHLAQPPEVDGAPETEMAVAGSLGPAAEAAERIMALVRERQGSDDATVVVSCPSAPVPVDPFRLRGNAPSVRRPRVPRRSVLATGATAGAGIAGTVAAGLWLAPRASGLIKSWFPPPPLPVAQAYLAAWESGLHNAQYDLLSAEAQRAVARDAFVERHGAVAAEMTQTAITARADVNATGETLRRGEAVIPFEAVYVTARYGELRRQNELPMVWEDGAWRVAWRPAVMLPDLAGGRRVRAFSEPAARGAILDVRGRPLAAAGVGEDSPTRVYPQAAVAGPLVGYTGEVTAEELRELAKQGFLPGDTVGKTGVEAAADPLLSGQRGGRLTVVVPSGEVAVTLAAIPARQGETVQLTLDLDVQREAEAALGDRTGSIVVIDPRDGAIRALATFPRYDPNAFATGQGVSALLNDPAQPLLNRPVQGLYPPGSIFKAITMAAALESKAFQPTSEFTCTGRWTGLPGLTHECWLKSGHGRLDFVSGLTQSCNSVFYEVGKRLDELDPAYLPGFTSRCGLGAPTGALLGREPAGIVPGPAWKQRTLKEPWTRGDAVNMAIGQGQLLVTPLQMATVYAAIAAPEAAHGAAKGPHLLQRALVPGGNVERLLATPNSPTAQQAPWSATTWDSVRSGLRGVISATNGTAAFVFLGSPLVAITAGKTGTAESAAGREAHAWFACFAPLDAPRAVVLVMLEYGGEGSRAAAPVARRLLEAVLPLS